MLIDLEAIVPSLPLKVLHCCADAVAKLEYSLRVLKGLVHDNAHGRRLSLQNKFVGSTLNSKSPLPVQSLKILGFIRTSVSLAGLVILR